MGGALAKLVEDIAFSVVCWLVRAGFGIGVFSDRPMKRSVGAIAWHSEQRKPPACLRLAVSSCY